VFLNGFKSDRSRKRQIFCPRTGYFLGLFLQYFWLNKINFALTIIPLILRVQRKTSESIANHDNGANSTNNPRNPETIFVWVFIYQ